MQLINKLYYANETIRPPPPSAIIQMRQSSKFGARYEDIITTTVRWCSCQNQALTSSKAADSFKADTNCTSTPGHYCCLYWNKTASRRSTSGHSQPTHQKGSHCWTEESVGILMSKEFLNLVHDEPGADKILCKSTQMFIVL